MGVLYDYFSAPSDEAAASTIDRVGGPGSQAVLLPVGPPPAAPPPPKRGLFGRRRPGPMPAPQPQFGTDESLVVFDTVSTKGIDPVVQMGTLEEALTGQPYDDITDDPRSGAIVASRDGGAGLVVALTDSLAAALVAASDERLAEAAVPWSRTEEFWGETDPADLAEFLQELAALARRAGAAGHRLYCWLSL